MIIFSKVSRRPGRLVQIKCVNKNPNNALSLQVFFLPFEKWLPNQLPSLRKGSGQRTTESDRQTHPIPDAKFHLSLMAAGKTKP
ncbi:MAG: hypothetical protein EA360_02955 [Balneolaceae bacterium]|nr:MAG: hypothetical protein EA360_02955 [Balneolaceae bacterium]